MVIASIALKPILKTKMKVALYVRVSPTHQEAENQLQNLRGFCKRGSYEIFVEYVMSGTEDKRPAFTKLFLRYPQEVIRCCSFLVSIKILSLRYLICPPEVNRA